MPKNVLKSLSVVLGVMFLFGCTGTKNVEIRRYVEVKDRIDQDMEEGNAGFLSGTPQPEDRTEIRKTRKTYVLEVSKESVDETEEVMIEESDDAVIESDDTLIEESAYEDYEEEDSKEAVGSTSSFVEYTVKKDDTMQKISKKFYDSYSKWPKIYEINKAVISNPDKIKPGIVLQIPME
jgi:nucleoid-associated protein YgaU